MSADETSETTELTAPAVIPADSFAAAMVLLRLIVDERACRTRLRELQAVTKSAERATAELVAARAESEKWRADVHAEIEEQRNELREREVKLAGAEGMLEHREQVLDARAAKLDKPRLEVLASGLVRDLSPGWRDPAPPEDETTRPSDGFAAGSTITRDRSDTPHPGRRVRRGAET